MLFHFFKASTADLASPCTPVPLLKENQEDDLSPGFFTELGFLFVCFNLSWVLFVCFLFERLLSSTTFGFWT